LKDLPENGIDMLNLEFISSMDESTSVCDKLLGCVGRLKSLRVVILDHSDATDAGCLQIAGLPHLSILDCSQTDITGSCFKALAALPELTQLYLGQCAIDETNLPALAKSPRLTTLELRSTRVHAQGLRGIAGCKELTNLSLRNNQTVGDECLDILRRFPKLRVLDVSNTKVTCNGLCGLHALPLSCITIGPSLKSQLPDLERIFPGKIELGKVEGAFVGDKSVMRIFAPLK
jgi:Leucine-rich repeat (LRR) protein